MAPLCYRRHRFPPGMSSGPCSALREPDPRSMPNRNRHVPRQPKPCRQHGGTGIGANRDIAVLWCDIAPPCASPPTAPPTERRTPARNPRFSTCSGLVCVRHGLSAGESWIRTSVPNDRLWALSWTPCNGPNARVINLSAMAICAMASSCNVALEVGSAGAGRVRIETGSLYPAPPPSGMLRLSRRERRHGSAFLLLRLDPLEPLHRTGLGHGLNRLWFVALCGGLCLLAAEFIETPIVHMRVEHF